MQQRLQLKWYHQYKHNVMCSDICSSGSITSTQICDMYMQLHVQLKWHHQYKSNGTCIDMQLKWHHQCKNTVCNLSSITGAKPMLHVSTCITIGIPSAKPILCMQLKWHHQCKNNGTYVAEVASQVQKQCYMQLHVQLKQHHQCKNVKYSYMCS